MASRRGSRSARVLACLGIPLLAAITGCGSVSVAEPVVLASPQVVSASPDVSTDASSPTASTSVSPAPGSVGTTTSPATAATRSTTAATTTKVSAATTPLTISGWRMDWSDNFSVPIEKTAWGRYGWGYQTPGNGYLGRYLVENTFTRNGSLVLRTEYVGGEWTCAGVSSGQFLNVAGGRWEIRAKFGTGKGIGYAFLLWPFDNSWPPEVDFVEGTVNGPKIMGSYHWGTASNEQKELRYLQNPDMKGWHTYGVIVGTDRITYTFDGQPWTVIVHPGVTTMKMALDFQTAALDPNGIFKPYETVPGGVPNPETPALVEIEIDWAAHYVAA